MPGVKAACFASFIASAIMEAKYQMQASKGRLLNAGFPADKHNNGYICIRGKNLTFSPGYMYMFKGECLPSTV